MITAFFLDGDKYVTSNLITRMVSDIIAYKANYIFYNTCMEIKVKENPDYNNRSEEVKTAINEYNHTAKEMWSAMYAIEILMKSEWLKEYEEAKSTIESMAQNYADIALRKCGWIKEENV